MFKTAVFAFCLTAFAHASSVPTQNMSPWSLGAEYYGALNGHTDLGETSLASHMLRLHYAPFGYLRFTAGIGASHPYSDPEIKGAEAGFSATGGVALYLPRLLDFLSLTGGYNAFYVAASQNQTRYWAPTVTPEGDIVGGDVPAQKVSGKTTGLIHMPNLGVIFHLGRYVDVEVGGQYRIFTVSNSADMTHYNLTGDYQFEENIYDLEDKDNSQARVYGSLTLHERESGAFLVAGAAVAPVVDKKDKDKGWLTRFSPWLQVGIMMRDPRGGAKDKTEYSDAYIDLKARQDSMADALRRDIERDKERNREEGRDEHDFGDEE